MTRQTVLKSLFFMLCCISSLWSQPTFDFDETGLENTLNTAQKEGKLVFYMVYASWCPHCHKMKEGIFPDPDVAALLHTNFIVGAQDVEQPGGRATARKYNVTSYPAFVVLDPQGTVLYGFGGEFSKSDFIKELQDASNPEKQLPYLRKAFQNQVSDANRCLALILALKKANLPTGEIAAAYLATQAKSNLATSLNWKIIANGVTDVSTREFQYVLKHQKEFAAVSSDQRVARKIENIISESLKIPAQKADTIAYHKQRALIQSLKLRKADSLVYVYDKIVYEKVKDWKSYQRATLQATPEFDWNNYQDLRNTAGIYLSEIKDETALKQAILWSKRATQLQESKDGYLQTALLYEKLPDIPNAITAAKMLREFCERVGFGTKEADDLLKRLQ